MYVTVQPFETQATISMKRLTPKSLKLISAALGLGFALLANPAGATLLYWDNNGTSQASSGTWDLTTPNWSTASTLTVSTVVWNTADAPCFSAGTAGAASLTVTMNTANLAFAGVFNGLTATSSGCTNLIITGSGSLSLNAGVQGFSTYSPSYNTIIRVPIGGAGILQNQASGSLWLSANNSYSGGTSLDTSAGLNFNNGSAFGSGYISNAVATTVLATPATDTTATAFATGAITLNNPVLTYGAGAGSMIYVGIAAAPTTFTGPWTLVNAAGTAFTMQNQPVGTTVTISGAISGAANFTKTGAGTLVLSGPNTYSGQTLVKGGILSVSSLNKVTGGVANSSLGHPTTGPLGIIGLGSTTTAGITLIYTGTGETTDRAIDLAGTTAGPTIENDGSGALGFSTAFTASGAGAKTLTLQGSNAGANTISGAIVGTSTAVTKAQGGTWVLSGANTYTGATAVNGGTLLVNGSLASSSAVTVTGAATLGGSGTINGTVSISTFGILAPGGVNNIGTLTLATSGNALTLNGGLLLFDLNTPATAGTTYDAIAIGGTGALVLNGANYIQLYSPSGTIAAGTYMLMTYASKSGSGTLTFANGTTTMGNFTLTVGATSVTLSVSADSPGALTWNGNISGAWNTTDQN